MHFKMGRESVFDKKLVVQHDPEIHYNSLVPQRLNAVGMPAEDFVALMGGVHTLGFIGEHKKGFESRWCMNPYVFDNTYFKEVILGSESKYKKTGAEA